MDRCISYSYLSSRMFTCARDCPQKCDSLIERHAHDLVTLSKRKQTLVRWSSRSLIIPRALGCPESSWLRLQSKPAPIVCPLSLPLTKHTAPGCAIWQTACRDAAFDRIVSDGSALSFRSN